MLFEDITQFKKAKEILFNNGNNLNDTFQDSKNNKIFSNLSELELYESLKVLNESFIDDIKNFISDVFKGDIFKIKSVLSQMKEEELKFNKEEYNIYMELYDLIKIQKEIESNKDNPNYKKMYNKLLKSRDALNFKMQELYRTYNEIFDSLEEKVKNLVNNNRKRKYFNIQRALDVLETRKDRYNKIKDITSKIYHESKNIRNLFNIFDIDEVKAKKDIEEAKDKVKDIFTDIKQEKEFYNYNIKFKEEPERTYNKRLKTIILSMWDKKIKEEELKKLINELDIILNGKEFKYYDQEKKNNLYIIYNEAISYFEYLKKYYEEYLYIK